MPQTPYGESMPAFYQEQHDPRRVYCSTCAHSEFVHGDYDARGCLYSECECSGFKLGVAA
jgi:hypothetical protein